MEVFTTALSVISILANGLFGWLRHRDELKFNKINVEFDKVKEEYAKTKEDCKQAKDEVKLLKDEVYKSGVEKAQMTARLEFVSEQRTDCVRRLSAMEAEVKQMKEKTNG